MTAVIGILNRQGVAIAADSAATVNGKTTNSALKIFTLSKYHPVGVMLYNSSAFMVTPWETIIKMYRKQLGNKSFATVADYQVDFIQYLYAQKFFADDKYIAEYAFWPFYRLANAFFDHVKNSTDTPEVKAQFIVGKLDTTIDTWVTNPNDCPEFRDYTKEHLIANHKAHIAEVCHNAFTLKGVAVDDNFIDKFTTLLFWLIKSKGDFFSHTGLVFVGFGEDEIYPALVPTRVFFPFDGRLRYYIEENNVVKISTDLSSMISPFAQTDTMNTILTGVSPDLATIYSQSFKTFLDKYKSQILGLIGDGDAHLIDTINGLDINKIHESYLKEIKEAKDKIYIDPLFRAVDNLSKEDMAEMAESLIYLTYLQKRITLAAEDVGGHVDVAVISKGDGFIWIKRKHYFNQELNRNFLDNYLTE